MDFLLGIDAAVFLAINGLAGRSVVADAIGIFFASHAIVVFFAAVALAGIVTAAQEKNHAKAIVPAVRAAMSAGVALTMNAIVSLAFFRERPFVALDEALKLIGTSPYLKSFPSDHAAAAFAVAAAVTFEDKRLAAASFVVAALIALARVYSGVHYPADVLAGAGVGVAAAALVRILSRPKKIAV